ncbi:SDR family oxidoreductase [Brevundimonas bacteroides]|uniref:SDR family oxidoreductase n=1 Tax=Brevundimonas bacteroides TaxID=74311 RepID=UPI000498133D|nr:SDR family oxidoreductase [Brevundimonas bacteroides]
MGQISNKVALVTGASRGIGRAIAERLAADGATVAVHYGNSADAAREVVSGIEAKGGKAFAVQGDVRKVDGISALFAAVDAELAGRGLSGLDILVNNAGLASYDGFAETSEATFDDLFDTNVKGLFFVAQHALPRLKENGRIINLSSIVARTYFAGIPAYSATKGAVNTLTKHWAAELGARGITVNAVAPGAIETDMSAWLKSEEGAQNAFAIQALKRVGQPTDIASVVAFLAGPDGAWVSGEIIEAAGGSKL